MLVLSFCECNGWHACDGVVVATDSGCLVLCLDQLSQVLLARTVGVARDCVVGIADVGM